MKCVYLYLCSLLISASAYAAIPEEAIVESDIALRELTVKGYDVRKHSDKYTLFLGQENSVLEERPYKLTKNGTVISQGSVISMPVSNKDVAEFYSSQEVTIRFGQIVKLQQKDKQIIVLKMKDGAGKDTKTIAFENHPN